MPESALEHSNGWLHLAFNLTLPKEQLERYVARVEEESQVEDVTVAGGVMGWMLDRDVGFDVRACVVGEFTIDSPLPPDFATRTRNL